MLGEVVRRPMRERCLKSMSPSWERSEVAKSTYPGFPCTCLEWKEDKPAVDIELGRVVGVSKDASLLAGSTCSVLMWLRGTLELAAASGMYRRR